MNKNLLKFTLGAAALTAGFSADAQCPTIPNCLGDTTITALAGDCDAIYDYNTPIGIDLCADTILFVSDNAAATEIPAVLAAAGYTVVSVFNDFVGDNNPTLQAANLANYAAIYWHAVGGGFGSTHNAATFTNLDTYVNNGGNVFVTGYDVIASPTDPNMYAFMGGTGSQDVPANGGQGALLGPVSSLTSGIYNTVGLVLNASTGDHDALTGINGNVFGVHPAGNGFDWTIHTVGAGEVAWVSSGQNTSAFADWSTLGSGYNEALLNFAANSSTSSTSMTDGMASGSNFPAGMTVVTYETVDLNGANPQTCSFTVTVIETEAPVADNANLADVTECISASPVAPTASDFCSGSITGTPDVALPITTAGLTVVTWTYTDASGNIATQTQNVTVNTVDVNTTTVLATITADASGASYQWLDCDNGNAIIQGEIGQSYTPSAVTGNYAVEVTENGCTDTSACTIIDYTTVDNGNVNDFNIYPNPSNGTFRVDLVGNNQTVQIFDFTGKIVFELNNVNDNSLNIDLSSVEAGIYTVTVTGNNSNLTKKLIIQ